jgi:hypothetical protein
MGFIDDIMADTDAAAFVDADLTPGAETITVGDGTTEWTVAAVVDRDPPEPVDGRALKPNASITVRNHATLGIALTSYVVGKYYVKLGTDTGGTAKKLFLNGKPTSQDSGMLTFEV